MTSTSSVRRWMQLVLGRARPESHSQRRYTQLARAALSALASRGVGVVVSVATVPLTLGYLGVERFGVWVAISTLLVWFTMADLGLGNGLLNALSAAYGQEREDLARQQVASTFWMLLAASAVLGACLMLAWPRLDWASLLNVTSAEARSEVELAIAVAFALALVGLPLGVAGRVWQAYQEGATANHWTAAGSIASLLGVLLVSRSQGGLPALVLGFTGGQLAVTAFSMVWLFGFRKRWLAPSWKRAELRSGVRLLRSGSEFFLLQLAALLLFQTDTLVITRLLGAEHVAEYSVPYRLFSYLPMIHALVLTPLWPAYAEAVARDDWAWVRRAFRRTLVIGMPIVTVLIVCLASIARPLIEVWTGGEIAASSSMVALMAVWAWMCSWGYTFAFLQNAVGRIRVQWMVGLAVAVVNVPLSIAWVRTMGVNGAILATVIAYGAIAMWTIPIDVAAILRGRR